MKKDQDKTKPDLLRELAELRQRLTELEASEAGEAQKRLAAILEGTTDFASFADPKGRVLYINRAGREMVGIGKDEDASRLSITDFHSDWTNKLLFDDALPVAASDGVWTGEVVFLHRDGHEIPMSMVLLGHKTPDGEIDFFSTISRDISEFKRSEEKLLESERRYRTLVETIPHGIEDIDTTGIITFANSALHKMHDFDEGELIGTSILDLVATDPERKGLREFLAMSPAEQPPPSTYFGKKITKKGRIIDVQVAWDYRRDEHGRVAGFTSVITDITGRKRLEEQLRQAQKLEAIGRLAGGVAHDFNNMLTAIMGNAELLLSDLHLADLQRKEVQEIRKAARRAASLTQQLLAFSRRQMLTPRVLDLNASVAEMEKMLRRVIGEDVELITELESALGSVKADPGQIGQVIINLALNARDAMPEGGELRIETANADVDEAAAHLQDGMVPGRYVMLVVSDTGRGMDLETREKIFEPFFTTKDTGAGTGLGLSTVYGIVKQSDGFIFVYSEPGHGTTFKIYLPRVDEATEPLEPRTAPVKPLHGTETVLLVEDEEAVRALARTVLQRNGYRVLEAPGGPDAVEISERHEGPINLLVTDVVMPVMSGRELAERLTMLSPELKVLYISGYAEETVGGGDLLRPGTAFLQKPFTPDVLAHSVRELLDLPANG
ncbi:MAG: PAS domain S-box protein [Acidobacteriota bacterium]